jgi:hypothetical protein
MKRSILRSSVVLAVMAVGALAIGIARPWTQVSAQAVAQAPSPSQGVQFAKIAESDMRQWLGYLASDALQGRQVFTEGFGLAAAYVAEQLRASGVKPMGDDGTYFQSVKRRGYRVVNNSSLTVTVNGQSRTFANDDHVTFPTASGGPQTLSYDGVEFVGYGMVNLDQNYDDFKDRDVNGKLVLWMPGSPEALGTGGGRNANRNNFILQTYNAGAVMRFAPAPAPPSAEEIAAQGAVDRANEAVAAAEAQLQQVRAAAL